MERLDSSMAKSTGVTISHIVGIRVRVLGTGNLKSAVFSLANKDGECEEQYLTDTLMTGLTDKMPTVLANFKSMAICYEFRTIVKDEVLTISKIIPFTKPSALSYPQ